jgi:hypothetical protein
MMSDSDLDGSNDSSDLLDNNSSNSSKTEWMRSILQNEIDERQYDPVTEAILVFCFSMLITFGALGNGLVMFVVSELCLW